LAIDATEGKVKLKLFRPAIQAVYFLVVISVVQSCERVGYQDAEVQPVLKEAEQEENVADPEKVAPPGLAAVSSEIASIAALAEQALVAISTVRTAELRQRPHPFDFFFPPHQRLPREMPRIEGIGSGFIVDLELGYILTNDHVIAGAEGITVRLANGSQREAEVVGSDPNTDIAVIRVPDLEKNGLEALSFADSDLAEVGELVIAVGSPFGLETSVSMGVISALGRGGLGIAEIGDFIQTDASINPGNSGGPLLNSSGDVVGVNTAIVSGGGAQAGIGFSVPSNLAVLVANRLIEDGEMIRGYLGAMLQELTPELAQAMELPENLRASIVAQVEPGGPAEVAGIEPGDVITAVDGVSVPTVSALMTAIGLKEPGSRVSLSLVRDARTVEIAVVIGEWPSQPQTQQRPAREDPSEGDAIAIEVTPLTPNLKNTYQLESDQGLVVARVQEKSPFWHARLQTGDLILSVNREPVSTLEQFRQAIAQRQILLLHVERAGRYFFADVHLNDQARH